MDKNYEAALAGTLKSSPSGTAGQFTIQNQLCVPLALTWLTPYGAQWGFDADGRLAEGAPARPLPPRSIAVLTGVYDGSWFVLSTQRSGAFVALAGKAARADTSYTDPMKVAVVQDDLVTPNAIGRPPQSTPQRPVPGSSPRVLVGCGRPPKAVDGVTVTREQYWQVSGDSYSLAPGERRTISYTETAGMESTTSEQNTVAASLGVSASAGWGPISASISASLSVSSTTFQQVTLSREVTTFVSREVENRSERDAVIVLVWQVIDVVTVYDPQGAPLASTISAVNPAIAQATVLPGSEPEAPNPAPDLSASPRLATVDAG